MFSLSERVIEEIIIYEINTDAIAEEIIISKKLERLRHWTFIDLYRWSSGIPKSANNFTIQKQAS